MRTHFQQGFSLIELMMVVAIIGILSIVAIPSYQNYVKRARFSEVITATEIFKTAVSLALQEQAPVNELNNDMHGIPSAPAPTKNLASITVENGVITATGTELVDNKTYILKFTNNGSNWSVEGSCVAAGWCES